MPKSILKRLKNLTLIFQFNNQKIPSDKNVARDFLIIEKFRKGFTNRSFSYFAN